MSYLSNFFVSIDQLGNVIAGGNPDNTISSRVGFYNQHNTNGEIAPWQWRLLKKLLTFHFIKVTGCFKITYYKTLNRKKLVHQFNCIFAFLL